MVLVFSWGDIYRQRQREYNLPSEKCNSIKHLAKHSFVWSVVRKAPSNRVGIKKKILLCEKNFDNFNFNVQPTNFWNVVL